MTLDLVATLHEELRDRLVRPAVPRETSLASVPGKIDVAVGMRRSGKTYLLLQAVRELPEQGVPLERVFYVDFEDDRLMPLDTRGAAAIIDGFYELRPENHDHRCHLFLDEIHVVPGWSKLVRRLHNSKRVRLVLSGSSAKLLSTEIATELRGRSFTTEVWPYSFDEYLVARGQVPTRGVLGKASLDRQIAALREYLGRGGFPEVVGLSPGHLRRVLQDYVNVVVLRDVVERHQVGNVSLVRHWALSLLRSAGRRPSIHKAYNDLKSQGRKVAKDTLYQYFGYFEDACMCFGVPLDSRSTRKQRNAPKKIYCVDPGLAAAVAPRGTMDIGQRFENLIFLDLRRAGYDVSYYVTGKGYEVDFVACAPDRPTRLLQVCWDTADAETAERELRALDDAAGELGISGELITSKTYLDRRIDPSTT